MTRIPKPLHDLSVAELSASLRARQVSAVEVAQHFLGRARSQASLGAYLATDEDVTLAQARAADARLAAGTAGPLEGVPMAHKDIFVTKDFPSTAGSRMLEGYRSPFDATVVRKLAEAGVVTLGKLNCDEFAMGSANENSAYHPVAIPGTPRACRAVHRAAVPPSWRQDWPQPPPAPTRGARSVSRLRFAASPASSRPTGGRRATG